MFEIEPARFASRFCPVVTSLAFKPGKAAVVIPVTGKDGFIPNVANGRVVCPPPVLAACELVKTNSPPTENECAPFVKLSVSAHCVNGLTVVRGDATLTGA